MHRFTAIVLLLACIPVAAAELRFEQWQVPWPDSRPRDPAVAPDARIWFAGQKGGYIGHLDPASGEFGRIELGPETGPHNVVVDASGTVWIAGNLQGWIGRLAPGAATPSRIALPDPGCRDPHTQALHADGSLWFTCQHSNSIVRLEPDSGTTDVIPVPLPSARPYGLVIAANGVVWAATLGSHHLLAVDPHSRQLRAVALPREDARPRRLGVTSNGDIWYVDYLEGYLGRYRPADGSFSEWRAPGGGQAGPYGMAIDADDRVWFAQTGSSPNRLVVFDTRRTRFTHDRAIDAGVIRHMIHHQASDSIWFGTDTNRLVRARLD